MPASRPKKALIIGAGPVGALAALSLHNRGWSVELWEGRDDPRGTDLTPSNLRSINLAISSRGLEALRSVDPALAVEMLEMSLPMKGRMIHHPDGRQESQLYDPVGGQCINSVSRPLLNLHLVQALPEAIPIRFNTKLSRVDFRTNTAYASDAPGAKGLKPGEEGEQAIAANNDEAGNVAEKTSSSGGEEKQGKAKGTSFDVIIGCDGSWSKVRSEMMRVERVDFSQSFIPHAYIELHMPPSESKNPDHSKWKISNEHLHIWPRHAFMLIALPNKDGSFTLTLFAPYADLEPLTTRPLALEFFRKHFPTALEWAGEGRMLDDFERNPRGGLVTINANPCHHSSSALLLGDASHSMVPFYGQGLNCGLEDVRVMGAVLDKHEITSTTSAKEGEEGEVAEVDLELMAAFEEYTKVRVGDLEAICELAMENYSEMRSHVITPAYHVRRLLDSALSTLFPASASRPLTSPSTPIDPTTLLPFPTRHVAGWSSLYTMVTFRPDVPYAEALRKERWQKDVVSGLVRGLGVGLGAVVAFGAWRLSKVVSARNR